MKKVSFLLTSFFVTGILCAQSELMDGVGGKLINLLPQGVTPNFETASNKIWNGWKVNDLVVAGSPKVGYKAYFRADDGENGNELWVTDGTQDGTHMVKDICVGEESSYIKNVARFNDKVVFSADDGTVGARVQMWISDGTEKGTYKIILNEAGSADPIGFTQVNEKQFVFAAKNVDSGGQFRLYVSDGTEEGTQMISDCIPVFPGDYRSTSYTDPWCRVGRRVFFKANSSDGQTGVELWVTDGSIVGTRIVKDINKGTAKSNLDQFVNFYNEKLFFAANDGIYGEEPWASDGTENGTYMIKDTNPNGSGGVSAAGVLPYDGRIWYRGFDSVVGSELFGTDLTEGNMTILDVNENEYNGQDPTTAAPMGMIPFDGMLVFNANTGKIAGIPGNYGAEQLYTDGETIYFPDGWNLAQDDASTIRSHFAADPIVVAGSLYWTNTGNINENKYELYRLDAIEQVPVKVTNLQNNSTPLHSLCNIGGKLLFVKGDDIYCYTYQKQDYDPLVDADNLEIEYRTREEIDKEVTTAVPENWTNTIMLYPNPTIDQFSFDVDGEILLIEIFDMLGQLVKKMHPTSNVVNVTSLADGIYKVVISTTQGTSVASLVVDK